MYGCQYCDYNIFICWWTQQQFVREITEKAISINLRDAGNVLALGKEMIKPGGL